MNLFTNRVAHRTLLLSALSCTLLGIGAKTSRAEDTAPAGPKPGEITITGLVDWYYLINGRAPHTPSLLVTPSGETIKIDNVGRSFDINDRDPSLSLGELNISRAEGKGIPFGIKTTLTVGDTARLVHATEPGGTSSWQTFQQLYITKTIKFVRKDLTIDFGKFVTPFGNEVIESSSNDNYSRSFLFQLGIPFYHAGLRLTLPLNSRFTLATGIVNGWNNVADDNNAKSTFAQLSYTERAFSSVLTYMGGAEGTGAYGSSVPVNGGGSITTHLLNFVPSYQVTSKLKVVGDFAYASAAGSITTPGAEGPVSTHVNGNWLGLCGYVKYQYSPALAGTVRLEQFEDHGGLRTGVPGYEKLQSYTLTLEHQAAKGRLVSRFEYRHDCASTAFFTAGAGTAKDQDTLTFGQVFKF